MLKIGDRISSTEDSSVPTDPCGRCQYCNNLSRPTKQQGDIFRGEELPLWFLFDEDKSQDCPWCALLVQCIKIFEPEWLRMVETDPEKSMWCVITQHNTISICWKYTSNVQIVERYSFQLYRSPSTKLLPSQLDIPVCPELAPEPGHELMWDYLRQCLMKCLWSHSECRAAQQLDWFPKRLLYLENTGGDSPNLRVIHTDEHIPSGPYIALSHCWGDAQPLRLLTTNIATFQQYIDFNHLPVIFQNGLTVAKNFGVNYVWIDSLCIIQDDRTDWALHARQMDQIFENAIIVVAAVSSKDGSIPFLGPEAPNERGTRVSHPVEQNVVSGALVPLRIRRFLPGDPDLTAFTGPLRQRAWAWQEHVLSTRIIHFTENQTIWECIEARGSEMMGSLEPRSDSMRTRMSGDEGLEKVWQHSVREYGKRSLTHPTDRLPAISGVAARFAPLFGTEYHAGLWRRRMPLELAWERSAILSLMSGALVPSLDNAVPSWSWASVNDPVIYGLENYFSGATVKYSVTDVDCEPSTDNPFGEVQPGSSVEVEGEYINATIVADERGFAIITKDGFEPQLVMPDCRLVESLQILEGAEFPTVRRALPSEDFIPEPDAATLGAEAKEKVSGEVICLLLFNGNLWKGNTDCAVVLILAPLGPKTGVMQRVALGRGDPDRSDTRGASIPWQWSNYETWENWETWFAGAEMAKFTLL